EASDQRGLDHVAGEARVLADEHAMTMVAAAKDQARSLPDLERQFRSDRPVGPAADAIGTEIFSSHVSPHPPKRDGSMWMIGQLGELFKTKAAFLRAWLIYFLCLSPRVGAGCVTLTGSEAGKLSSRPCSRERSSMRLRVSPASRLDFSSVSSSTRICFGPAMQFSLQAARSSAPFTQITSRRETAFLCQAPHVPSPRKAGRGHKIRSAIAFG